MSALRVTQLATLRVGPCTASSRGMTGLPMLHLPR